MIDSLSDETLALRAQDGDLDAYNEIVNRYQGRLWGVLFKFFPHQSELEDLVQNAFIRAFQRLHQWKSTGSFKSWLVRVAINVGYDYFRQRRNEPISLAQQSASDGRVDPSNFIVAPVSEASSHPNAELIELLLAELRPEDRLIVTLHYYEGFAFSEIAEQLGWGLSKTKLKCHRARQKLESLLKYRELEFE